MTATEQLAERIVKENGYLAARVIDGRIFVLQRLAFTTGILVNVNEWGYSHRYCYPNHADALEAFATWDGKGDAPGNWIKRKGEGGDFANPNYEECA